MGHLVGTWLMVSVLRRTISCLSAGAEFKVREGRGKGLGRVIGCLSIAQRWLCSPDGRFVGFEFAESRFLGGRLISDGRPVPYPYEAVRCRLIATFSLQGSVLHMTAIVGGLG